MHEAAFGLFAASSFGLFVNSKILENSDCNCEGRHGQDTLSSVEAKELLKKSLKKIRNENGLKAPVYVDFDEGKNSYSLKFKIHNNAALLGVLVYLMRTFPGLELESVHEGAMSKKLSLSSKNKDYSFVIYSDDEQAKLGSVEFTFYKKTHLTTFEVESLVEAYGRSGLENSTMQGQPGGFPSPFGSFGFPGERRRGLRQLPENGQSNIQSHESPKEKLESMGLRVYLNSNSDGLDWSDLAGCSQIRESVEFNIIGPLQNPKAYDSVARETRARFESNRPRSILFEGPPGTGKTTTARIIANKAGMPLVYLPVESVTSKWYGESEKKLTEVFDCCEEMGNVIIFLDEIDSLATSRDNGGSMHEATRRLLGVLLRKLEGFDTSRTNKSSILIAATNRKQDLDAALLSRFAQCVYFPIPSKEGRVSIFERYAKHLSKNVIKNLANMSNGFSARDIKESCENSERSWIGKQIRLGNNENVTAPPAEEYIESVKRRKDHATKMF